MARKTAAKKTSRGKSKTAEARRFRPMRFLGRVLLTFALALVVSVAIYRVVAPPTTATILSEGLRLGSVQRQWVSMDDIAPVVARSVVAAEDANFCLHWGIDMVAVRLAIAEGADRGASTLTQRACGSFNRPFSAMLALAMRTWPWSPSVPSRGR